MKDFCAYFKGKKITVMGLGLLGRGVGDVAFLAECGADLVVTDMKTETELQESLEKLKQYPHITYRLGGHVEDDFRGKDMILKAAGVPLNSQYIDIARKDGAEIAMSGALFAALSGIPVIGVTGTRGKSTVTHMIHHVLMHLTEGAKVLLGGNVRGVSNLQLLKEVEEGSLAVMELDSWQLQGFGEKKISPLIAVFTNFMEDHLNYYGDMDAYFADKANIFLHQEAGSTLVTTNEVFEKIQVFMKTRGEELDQEIQLVNASVIPDDALLTMPGEHNRLNAALAYEALKAAGLSDEEVFEGLATFPGVPGRLEYLGETHGIKVYNDNNATTPQATIAGIKAVSSPAGEGKNVILIAGGSYKDVDPAPLVPVMSEHCKKILLIPGTGTNTLMAHIAVNRDIADKTEQVDSLTDAVDAGLAAGEPGDVLLFSPAFASFGPPPGGFKNEYERNDAFVRLVREKLNHAE